MKSLDDIKKLALKSKLFENPKVSFLAEGHGNYNYILVEKDKKYVLRIKKSKEKQFINSLEKEYHFLTFFESEGINFCPKALFYSKEDNFLIENFLEGELLPQSKFNDDQIKLFAKQLNELFNLDISKFEIFCKKNNFRNYLFNDPISSLKKFGFGRFDLFKNSDLDKEILNWIEKNLNDNLNFFNSNSFSNKGFSWGDIQTDVLVNSEGKMFFYDFEFVSISTEVGFSYIKIHGNFNEIQFDKLLDYYSKFSNIPVENLNSEILFHEKITRVNDVVWAAMMWHNNLGLKEENFYKQLIFKRIKLFENI